MTSSRATSRPTAGEPDFPAWLAGLSDDALVQVCELRPDVATPPPSSVDVLASRLRLPASTARAMGSLSWPELLVLATAAAVGADSGAVPLSAVAERLGVDDDDTRTTNTRKKAEKSGASNASNGNADAAIATGTAMGSTTGSTTGTNNAGTASSGAATFRAAVARLRDLTLLWGEPDHVRIVPVTASAIAAAPVVAPHPGEPTGAALEEAWAGLSEPASGVLEAIARGRTPVGALGAGASESLRAAATELAAAGLAEIAGGAGDTGRVAGAGAGATGGASGDADAEFVVPRAHALDRARHGPRRPGSSLLHLPAWSEPVEVRTGRAAKNADASGGVAALELLHRCDSVLDSLSTAPMATLKAGGVGVRELRRVARASQLEESELPLLLDVLAAAGLIAVGDTDVGDATYDSVWAPTEAADIWSARESARRWAELVLAWWTMPRAPWRVGAELEGGGTVPALGDPIGPPPATERARVLGALAGLDPAAEPGDTLLPEVVRWFSPVWLSRAGSTPVIETVAEARRMGLVVDTTATSAARLLAGRSHTATSPGGPGAPTIEDLEPILAAALPDPVSEVIVQADLTILAPGPLVPELAAEFALLADVESAGAATTYRVTETTLRRALDAGRTASGVRDLLARTSLTPVPQSLDYLVEDVARRHGRLRVGTALSFVRCDDPSLVAQVLGSPVAERCALRSVAPTVLISQARPLDLVEALRDDGFAPVVEDTTGAVVALTRPVARVQPSTTGRAIRIPTRAPGPSELRAAVAAMRSADRVRSARSGGGPGGPGGYTGEAAIARLHEAASTRTAVTVTIANAQGRSTARLIVPATVAGGRIEGIEPDTAEAVTLPLHRVISVADVDPTR